MSEARAIATLWLREVKRYFRDRTRVISSFVQPALWLLIFGSAVRISNAFTGITYQEFIFPGIIGQTMLFTAMFMGVTVIWDREFGFLKEIMVAPVSSASIFIGKVLGNGTAAIIQALITFLLSFIIEVPITGWTFLYTLPVMILDVIGLVCIGLVIASFMGSLESFGVIQSFVSLPLFFLSGALFPLTGAPLWIQIVSYFDPLTYSVDLLRVAILGSAWTPLLPVGYDFLIMILFDIGMILFGTWSFSRRK
jgi:ABC-2 type transport system permease protein